MSEQIAAYQFADGVFYRLKKPLNKKGLGITLKSCKELLTLFYSQGWETYEIWAFVDTLIYEMKKNMFPLDFRMFYAITYRYLSSGRYVVAEEKVQAKYRDWINKTIEELKAI